MTVADIIIVVFFYFLFGVIASAVIGSLVVDHGYDAGAEMSLAILFLWPLVVVVLVVRAVLRGALLLWRLR